MGSSAAFLFSYEGWILGYQTGYDTQRSKMTISNLAFGRKLGNYAVHTYA